MKPFDKSGIDIQPITIDESSAVLDLWIGSANWLKNKAINQWDPDSFKIEDIIEYINKGSEVFLARIDKDIVGTFIICWSDPDIWEELDTFETAYIHKFAVNRRFKGLGVGAIILDWVEEYVESKGKRLLRLDCLAENQRLNKYYHDLKFKYIRCKASWQINLYEKAICE